MKQIVIQCLSQTFQPLSIAIRATCITVLVAASASRLYADESRFMSKCREYESVKENFAVECQRNARRFSRKFSPGPGYEAEIESYSVYFYRSFLNERFVLGCVKSYNDKISYLGMYFTPITFSRGDINKADILFVDPDDNIGLQIDGIRHTFLAVRQFVSNNIPARYKDRPNNCEAPRLVGESIDQVEKNVLRYCLEGNKQPYCKKEPFVFLDQAQSKFSRPLFADHDAFYIDDNAELAVREDLYISACHNWRRNLSSKESIILEVCH